MYKYDVESIDDPCVGTADSEKSFALGMQLLVPDASLVYIPYPNVITS